MRIFQKFLKVKFFVLIVIAPTVYRWVFIVQVCCWRCVGNSERETRIRMLYSYRLCVSVCVCVWVCVSVFLCVCVSVSLFLCACVCVSMCHCVCLLVCVFIHVMFSSHTIQVYKSFELYILIMLYNFYFSFGNDYLNTLKR